MVDRFSEKNKYFISYFILVVSVTVDRLGDGKDQVDRKFQIK